MDRQTLDMEGARQGEISAASLQIGNHTIAIQRIATMSVESHEFAAWDTPSNRASQNLCATGSMACGFFGLIGVAWFALRSYQADAILSVAIGGGLLLFAAMLGLRALVMSSKIKKKEPYYRLSIGTSDGRQIPLVDNNRDALLRLRDVIRHKLDTNDTELTGDFDLNLDIVNIKAPAGGKFAQLEPLPSMFDTMAPAPPAQNSDAADPEILFDDEKAAAS